MFYGGGIVVKTARMGHPEFICFVILNKNILKIAFLHEVSGYGWWCIWINR